MLDLAATNDKALNIAANATTYVAIADDEPAEKQVYTVRRQRTYRTVKSRYDRDPNRRFGIF